MFLVLGRSFSCLFSTPLGLSSSADDDEAAEFLGDDEAFLLAVLLLIAMDLTNQKLALIIINQSEVSIAMSTNQK